MTGHRGKTHRINMHGESPISSFKFKPSSQEEEELEEEGEERKKEVEQDMQDEQDKQDEQEGAQEKWGEEELENLSIIDPAINKYLLIIFKGAD